MRPSFLTSFVNVAASAAAALLLIALMRVPLAQEARGFFAFGDLRAFYCAARTAAAGFDPYRAEPIGACERGLVGLQRTNFVVPSPLPGDAIALFEPLAAAPFPVAAALWCALLAATYFGLCAMLARLTNARYPLVLAVCLPLAFMIPIDQGQLVPLAVTMLVGAGLALRMGNERLAAVLASAATIEPHIGLPVCIALFAGRSKARLPLAAAGVVLAALSLHVAGFAGVREYVTRVLPEHIAAEARFDDQYSLTYLLTWLRIPVPAALALGQFSYWAETAAAVGAALTLARRWADQRYLVLVPMAFSIAGGPYVHEEHLLAAVPLALLLATTARGAARTPLAFALLLVACPAKFVLDKLHAFGLPLRLSTDWMPPPAGPLPLLADAVWGARIESNAAHLASFCAKTPSWLGLFVLAAFVAALSLRRAAALRDPRRRLPGELRAVISVSYRRGAR